MPEDMSLTEAIRIVNTTLRPYKAPFIVEVECPKCKGHYALPTQTVGRAANNNDPLYCPICMAEIRKAYKREFNKRNKGQ